MKKMKGPETGLKDVLNENAPCHVELINKEFLKSYTKYHCSPTPYFAKSKSAFRRGCTTKNLVCNILIIACMIFHKLNNSIKTTKTIIHEISDKKAIRPLISIYVSCVTYLFNYFETEFAGHFFFFFLIFSRCFNVLPFWFC